MGRPSWIVTQEDIDVGLQGDCWHCPLSLAGSRALGKPVEVSHHFARFRGQDRRIGRLPDEARQFILDFDAGRPVKPFTFELERVGPRPRKARTE